jgi:hypothetical protein
MHLAVNGWTLAKYPEAPNSAHLIEMLTMLVETGEEVSLTLLHPDGALPDLPKDLKTIEIGSSRSSWGRFGFEQRQLPKTAKRIGADLLFFPYAAAALTSAVPVVALFADLTELESSAWGERLCWAFGRAGVAGARRVLAFDDVPIPSFLTTYERVVKVPA